MRLTWRSQAYGYGLPYHVAMASVTTAPAELLGMGERIGKVKSGHDADIVVWDSDPLSVGATPIQVWIDGTAQFPDAVELEKTVTSPIVPDVDLAAEIVDTPVSCTDVLFTGVSQIVLPGREQTFDAGTNVIIKDGGIACIGSCEAELASIDIASIKIVSLKHGHLIPPLTAFGSDLGLSEIQSEDATQNGRDPDDVFSLAIDGLQFQGKQLHASFAHGVVNAISAPMYSGGGQHGVSVGFSTGASHSLERDAVWNKATALHYTLSLSAKSEKTPSISSAIAALRSKLTKAALSNETDIHSETYFLQRVIYNSFPLTITVHSADAIAALIRLKFDIESSLPSNNTINLVLLGAAESHLVAKEIAASKTSVVLAPLLAYAVTWDQRRSLTGAPLTNGTTIDKLLDAGVLVAIAATEGETWEVRNLNLMAGIVYKNGGGRLSRSQALGMVSENFGKILGTKIGSKNDFVIFEGDPLEIGGRVKAVGTLGRIDLF